MPIGYLSKLNPNLNILMNILTSNQELCKLLHYTSEDCLLKDDIEDTSILIYDNILPYQDTPKVETEKAYLEIYFDRFVLDGATNKFKDGLIIIDILIHKNLRMIQVDSDGNMGKRAYELIKNIDLCLNETVDLKSIGKIRFNTFGEFYANDIFDGLRIVYSIKNMN